MIGLTESTQRLVVLPVLSATKVAALPQSMQDIQTLKHEKKTNLRSHLVQQDTQLMELNIPLKEEKDKLSWQKEKSRTIFKILNYFSSQ